MRNRHRICLRNVRVGSYSSLLSVCQDGYSFSSTPVPGFENSEVLARINECCPLISTDGSFKSEILKTVFNVGLKRNEGKPLWIVPNSIRHSRHSLLKKGGKGLIAPELEPSESILHRQFAGLAKKDDGDILKFASKYGLLKRHLVHSLVFRKGNSGQQLQLGESLLWWQEEIRDLAACLELWDTTMRGDGELKDTVLWHRDGIAIRLGDDHVPLVSRANMNLLNRWSREDTRGPVLYYLSLEADKRLLNALTPKVLPFQNFETYLFPDTLLAAIWLMFLVEINGGTRLIQCTSCQEYFDARDPRAIFCSARCRMRNHRKRRKDKSKQKKSKRHGGPRKEIVKQESRN